MIKFLFEEEVVRMIINPAFMAPQNRNTLSGMLRLRS